jgi:hypothetical protein
MITLFTLPKPFLGHIGMIQGNAIQSWTRLHPDIDILMFGNEQGTAEVAAEFGIRHFPDVDVNEYGTPQMSGYFQQAEEAARHSHMCYENADIILFPDLLEAVAKVDLPKFVMGGLRTDYDIAKPVDFTRHDWAEALREDAKTNGTLHGFGGIDYFVYPRGMFGEIPQFALGRWYWDQWLVYRARRLGGALIDATAWVMAIHQNHDYRHIVDLESKRGDQGGIESFGNRLLVKSILMTFALVVVTTPDECFRILKADHFLGSKESVTVVDCWRCLDPSVTNHPEINYLPLGRCLDDAPAANALDAIWAN